MSPASPYPASRRAQVTRRRRLALAAAGATLGAIVVTLVIAVYLSGSETADSSASGEARSVLAVLPFEPLAADPNTAYFGIGLADSMVSHLSRVPGLTVRPLTAALTLAAGIPDPREAGRRLNADAIMVGHYQREKDTIRVTVQLVDVKTGFTLWGHTIEAQAADQFRVEQQIAWEALGVLAPGSDRDALARELASAGHDATAHYLYTLARGKMATLLVEVIPEVIQLVEQSIRSDPDFAPAHALLSEASANMFLGGLSSDTVWLRRAEAAARRAIDLDEKDPEAHVALGYAMLFLGDPVETMRETLRALEVAPGHAGAQRMLGSLLAGAGIAGPVRKLRDKAVGIDPSIEIGWLDVQLAVLEGTVDRTVASLQDEVDRRRAAGRSAEVPIFNLGYLAFVSGDAAAGLRWAAMLETVSASTVYADVTRLLALGRAGDAEGVLRIIDKNRESLSRDWEYSQWVGRALAAAGEKEKALSWLDQSARLGSYQVWILENDDTLDGLRADPRFQEQLATVGERAQRIAQLAAFAGYR